MTDYVASPSECLKVILTAAMDFVVKVGPLTDEEQQTGGISIMDAGMPVVDLYAPLLWTRAQMRCVGGTLARADVMGRSIQKALNALGNRTTVEVEDGSKWLVHQVNLDGGPSMHFDSSETWEDLLFASVLMSAEPVETP